MEVIENYNFIKIEIHYNTYIEFQIDRGKKNIFVKDAVIYIPSLEKWSILFPNLLEQRDAIVKFIKDFALAKSSAFYKYRLEYY